jgi:hypothetical protein
MLILILSRQCQTTHWCTVLLILSHLLRMLISKKMQVLRTNQTSPQTIVVGILHTLTINLFIRSQSLPNTRGGEIYRNIYQYQTSHLNDLLNLSSAFLCLNIKRKKRRFVAYYMALLAPSSHTYHSLWISLKENHSRSLVHTYPSTHVALSLDAHVHTIMCSRTLSRCAGVNGKR